MFDKKKKNKVLLLKKNIKRDLIFIVVLVFWLWIETLKIFFFQMMSLSFDWEKINPDIFLYYTIMTILPWKVKKNNLGKWLFCLFLKRSKQLRKKINMDRGASLHLFYFLNSKINKITLCCNSQIG